MTAIAANLVADYSRANHDPERQDEEREQRLRREFVLKHALSWLSGGSGHSYPRGESEGGWPEVFQVGEQ